MKTTKLFIFVLILILAASVFLVAFSEDAGNKESTISVNAEESVKAAPDIAYVYIGVVTDGDSAELAQNENARLSSAFVEAIKAEGVEAKDIETSYLNIYQDYSDTENYRVDNTYKVTVRDIDNVGAVIDAAIAAGANSTYSLSFDIEDRDALYLEALGKAIKSVGAKAEAVAQSGGYTITGPKSIVENGSSGYYGGDLMRMESAAADSVASGMATPISPGDIEVSASVTGTYIIQ